MSLIPPAPDSPRSTVQAQPPAAVSARRGRRAARWLLTGVAALWGLLLIAWLSFHWVILPHIEKWRAPIEQRASRALGVPVKIGRIEVRSRGWVPSFELQEVTLQGPDGQPALRLPRVVAAISPRSLLAFELDFERLQIDAPELDVRRDPSGRVFVAGIDLGRLGSEPRAGDDSGAADWFFRQHEVVVRGGAVRWRDEQRGAPALTLVAVDLVVRNGLRQHALRLDATPPADSGQRFSISGRFSQPLLARRGDWQRWSGSVFASLPGVDLGRLRRHVDLPFELSQGSGSLRAWVDVAGGAATAATVDLGLTHVALRLAPGLEPLAFSRVEGRLIGRRDRDGSSLEARNFSFDTADALHWPRGTLKLDWRQRQGEPAGGGTFSADHLDIGLMARIASRIPLGEATRRALAELRPEGAASAVEVRWDGAVDAPLHYRVKGRLAGLSLAAKPSLQVGGIGRPGLRNADLQVDASETGGTARIDILHGALDLPGIFAEALVPLDRLGGRILWKIMAASPGAVPALPRGLSVQVQDLDFANADAHGQLDARWSSDDLERLGTTAAPTTSAPASAALRRELGRLELDGQLGDGVATRVHRYLPLALSAASRDYIERAVRGGKLTSASVHIRGELRDFPFFRSNGSAPAGRESKPKTARPAGAHDRDPGEFRIAAKAEDVSFAYVPAANGGAPLWPMVTAASGELLLDRGTFSVRNGRGRIGNVEWTKIGLAIEHLDSEGVLALDASARGPLADLLGYVDASPIGGWLGHVLDKATASGSAELKLGLGLPLLHIDTGATVKGSVTLTGNDLRITPDSPLLGNAHGRVDFTERGFAVVAAGARVYGGDATFEGGTRADGKIGFAGQGTATAEGLRRAEELGPVARLASALSGQTSYRVNLAFHHDEAELAVDSNLVGIASDLPSPLAKPAELPLALHYQTRTEPAGPAPAAAVEPPRELLQIELGDRVRAHYLRETTGGDSARVIRGGIGVFAPAPTPARGVAARVDLKSVDVDAWQAALDRLFLGPAGQRAGMAAVAAVAANTGGSNTKGSNTLAADTGATGRPAQAPSVRQTADAASAASAYQPATISLQVGELKTGGRRLTHLTAGLSQADGVWRANLDARELAGYIEYRAANQGAAAAGGASGRVFARLARLSLPKSDAEGVSNLLDERPANVPALDVVVDDFELNGLRLGRVEVEASSRSAGPVRDQTADWQLTRFAITTPEAQLVGSGLWTAPPTGPIASSASSASSAGQGGGSAAPPPRRMALDFKLQVADSGALLDRLGTSNVIRGGKGELSGKIGWLGSPFALDCPSLSGQLQIAIDKGQFLKADPGAARLLGVLSLQSLPRRLSLDFRDVFDAGFAFDEISGDLAIERGVARTNNLRMRGVQAAVLMEGAADIGRETQDLRVVVVPEINAGTAALAYAVINPAIGLGAFLAQALLKKPLTAAGTREFHITGPWADPKVLPVARRLSDPVPTVEPAASAGGTQQNQ